MLWYVASRNLLRNRRRTLAILITISLGTAFLALYGSINSGILEAYRQRTIHAKLAHGQINTKGYRDTAYEKPWDHWIPNFPEVEGLLRQEKAVKEVFPRVSFFSLLSKGSTSFGARGEGIIGEREDAFFDQLNFVEGTGLGQQKDGIILGAGVARALSAHPGDTVTVVLSTVFGSINAGDYVVTGVFKSGLSQFDNSTFRIQLSEAQKLLDSEKVETVFVGLHEEYSWDVIARLQAEKMSELESAPFEQIDDVFYGNAVRFLRTQYGTILGFVLVVVLLSISNTISMIVFERRQELGNLRANGESKGEALLLLGMEGFFLGLLGCALGALLTAAIYVGFFRGGYMMPPPPAATREMLVHLAFSPISCALICAVGIVTAVLATLLAGWRVISTPIAELLRSH